jgi:hypothetical protein
MSGVRVAYRIFTRPGMFGGIGAGAVVAVLWNIPWLLRGAEEGSLIALYLGEPRSDDKPELVFRVAEEVVRRVPRTGSGEAFGQVEPLGALGVRVGDEMVWPTYPPRHARRFDPTWAPLETEGAGA